MTLQIAIILIDTLQRIGIQSIFEEFFPQTELLICSADEISPCDESNIYVTDSTTYAAMQDFFIPRRTRCLVVATCSAESVSPRIVGVNTSLEHIVDEMNALITIAKNGDDVSQAGGGEELSAREVQVLTQIVSGAINKEIATRLNISLNTVLTHRKNITSKLGIKTVSGLTLYALMHGYIRS